MWRSFVNDIFTGADNPWVVFGDSYAGALSAWFRLKFPHLTCGSLASSGVVLAVHNFTKFDKQIGDSGGPKCTEALQEGTRLVDGQLQYGRNSVRRLFGASMLENDGHLLYLLANAADCAPAYLLQLLVSWFLQRKFGGCPGRDMDCLELDCGDSCAQLEAIYVSILNVDRYWTIAIISDFQLLNATWEIHGCQLTGRDMCQNSVRLTTQIQGNDMSIPWDSGSTNVLEVVLQWILSVLHCDFGYALLYPSQEMHAHWCLFLSEVMQCKGKAMLIWLISSIVEVLLRSFVLVVSLVPCFAIYFI
jgi:hypothetical protein